MKIQRKPCVFSVNSRKIVDKLKLLGFLETQNYFLRLLWQWTFGNHCIRIKYIHKGKYIICLHTRKIIVLTHL